MRAKEKSVDIDMRVKAKLVILVDEKLRCRRYLGFSLFQPHQCWQSELSYSMRLFFFVRIRKQRQLNGFNFHKFLWFVLWGGEKKEKLRLIEKIFFLLRWQIRWNFCNALPLIFFSPLTIQHHRLIIDILFR